MDAIIHNRIRCKKCGEICKFRRASTTCTEK